MCIGVAEAQRGRTLSVDLMWSLQMLELFVPQRTVVADLLDLQQAQDLEREVEILEVQFTSTGRKRDLLTRRWRSTKKDPHEGAGRRNCLEQSP